MMRSRVDTAKGALAIGAVLLAALGAFGRARAQTPPPLPPQPPPQAPPAATQAPAPPAGPVDKNALTPPQLLAFVDAGYPEEARAEQLQASVLMVITIGDDGFVEEAALAGPPVGHGFDELALAAARRFVFEPATRGGQPLRARIQYRYEFTYQPPADAATTSAAPTTARIRVTLRSAENDKAIKDAEVIVTSPSDPAFALRLVSDEAGQAVSDELAPGKYDVAINHPRFSGERHTEELTVGEETELTYRLQVARSYEEYGATARVKAPAREVTRRTIQREELTRVAGTRGDALRTIELLPGVGRPPFTAGVVLIRGAGPSDSTVLLDGVPVPQLYHFGGLTSFINSRALDRIDFYPGNFSVRFGRAMGGIIDVGTRDPRTDGYHGVIDTNIPLDSSLLVEGPLGDKASFMVGGRRSYLGDVLKAVIPKDTFGALAAPVYWDYQGFINYRPTDRDRIRLGAYGSSDRLDVLFANNDDDPGIQGLELGTSFHRVALGWKHQYSRQLEHDIQVSYGRTNSAFKLPPEFILDIETNEMYLRAEWRYRMSRAAQLIVGTDSRLGNFSASYIGPSPGDFESNEQGASFEALPEVRYRKRSPVHDVSGFVELALTPIRRLRIVPGLRVDYHSLIGQYSFDPRVAAIVSVTDALKLKAGVGVFSQPPEAPQQLAGLGNPDLLYSKAIHYSGGFEYDFTDVLSLGMEGFYKSLYRRVVAADYQAAAERGIVDPPPYDNDGIGRVYGLEVSGRKQAKGRWFGFLSYTLMKSERKDHDQGWKPFVYDQRHILALAGTVRLGRGWEIGGTLRVVTGNPRTPIVGASYDQDVGAYTADNGRTNSARNPTFRRLDVRFEKQWKWDHFRLAAYLDIQNATNAKNPEGVSYSFNYKESETIRGLIFLPVLGLRGEL